MSLLKEKSCIPCQGGVPPLEMSLKDEYKLQLDERWQFTHDKSRLSLSVKCEKFDQPMKVANEIAILADEQWHHPDLHISFGNLKVDIWTHKIDNLVESDFIFAAKVDEVLKKYEL
jgi:4a-hydroxytetrahydrobiopterin dehydratase